MEVSEERVVFTGIGSVVDWRKFPVRRNDKSPAINDWKELATSDPLQIEKWKEQDFPDCNWGIVTGNGLVVVDVDKKNGKDGLASLSAVIGYNEQDLDTYTVGTPSGGQHLYFLETEEEIHNKQGVLPGIDIRGTGGLVVAPGSSIDGKSYTVLKDKPLLPLPDWLKVVIREKPRTRSPVSEGEIPLKSEENLLPLLEKINPSLPYEPWRNVIWSVLGAYGESQDTIDSLREWSEGSSKYEENAFDKVVNSYDPSKNFDSLEYWKSQYPNWSYFLPSVPSSKQAEADKLADIVSKNTIARLTSDGNKLTEEHRRSLGLVAKALSYSAYTSDPKRIALPLFTGGGKTQSVIAHASEVIQGKYDIGIWVAVGTIDQIDEIREGLRDRGVQDNAIGVKHSGRGSNVTTSNASEFQILLVTHERIKSCDYSYLTEYQGKKRQLIWDEALIAAKSEHLSIRKLMDDMSLWKSRLKQATWNNRKAATEEEATERYFEELERILSEVKDQEERDLPEHPGRLALKGVYSSPLLEKLENPTSKTAWIDKGSHAFWFTVQVPDEFQNIVILDASSRVRKLQQYDTSITILPIQISKDYSSVTIWFCKTNQGRHTVDDPKKNGLFYQEVSSFVKEQVPEDQSVVVYTLPEQEGVEYPPQRLRTYLGPGDSGRVTFKSWGEAKGINSLRDIQYGTHIGLVYRESNELKTAIAAQKRDYRYEVDDKQRWETQLSEHVDQIYQGLSRLACRKTADGKAEHTEFLLFYPSDKIINELQRAMPGVVVKEYKPKYLKPIESPVFVAQRILEHLLTSGASAPLEDFFGKKSISSVRKELGLERHETDSDFWSKVIDAVKEGGVSIEKRSFVTRN